MAVNPMDTILANQNSASSSSTSSTKAGGALGKDSFMKLLISQLQNQDPMNPMENTEFTSQLAQFSQLESLDTMKTTMEQLSQLQVSMNNIETLSFIGKKVSAAGNNVEFTGNAVDLGYTLKANANGVKVAIVNADGTTVRTIEKGATTSGNQTIAWDGKDNNGNTVETGRYTYQVQAYDTSGNALSATTYATGTVTGVRYDNGTTYLIIGDKEVTISDVQKIIG